MEAKGSYRHLLIKKKKITVKGLEELSFLYWNIFK